MGVKANTLLCEKKSSKQRERIAKSLRKENLVIRLRKREMFDGASDARDRVLTFLEDKRLHEVVQSYTAERGDE